MAMAVGPLVAVPEMSRHREDQVTVGELIVLLSAYPAEQRVLVDGYEDGYTEPNVHDASVSAGHSGGWWSGDWDDDKDGEPAVVVGR